MIQIFQILIKVKDKIKIFGRINTGLMILILIISSIIVYFYLFPHVKDTSDFYATNETIPKKTLDCMTCHTRGTVSFKANDTINLKICNDCHKEGLDFLVVISSGVHKYHQGNISNLPPANYIERHTEIIISCDSCHVFTPNQITDCKVCHKGNDHVKKDVVCSNCHGYISELFIHNTVKLVTHDKFGDKSCVVMCHSEDKVSLRLFNNIPVPITESQRLCKQCHYGTYNDWTGGLHYSNQTCVDCHNPHNPKGE
jgi:hypothetical protein